MRSLYIGAVAADRLEGVSPEGLPTSLALASVGSRSIAGTIDLALQVVLILFIAAGLGEGNIAAAAKAVLGFIVLFFLPIAYDMLDQGRGPGKRIIGLRVVTLNGGPISFRASAIRNLLRFVDFLPSGYLVGMTAVFTTNTAQRLGDIAAGTVVSFVPGRTRKKKKNEAKRSDGVAAWNEPVAAFMTNGADVTTARAIDAVLVSNAEVGLVQSFLTRRRTLPEPARARLAAEIAGRLRPKVMGVPAELSDEEFLELLATAKSIRR